MQPGGYLPTPSEVDTFIPYPPSKRHPAALFHVFRIPTFVFMRVCCVLLLALSAVSSQFGNLEVKWDKDSTGQGPRVTEESTNNWVAPADVRRTSLAELPIDTLIVIVKGMGKTCTKCVTQGHWVSRVRSACLESTPKNLKAALTARGIKCNGCSMREHYLDRLLDSVHLPVLLK